MFQDDTWLFKVIGSEEEETQLKEGIGNEVGIFFDFLFITDNKFEAFLSLQWRVHVGQAGALHQVCQQVVIPVVLTPAVHCW